MGMSEDIMKGGIPDDCNAWTKTGIVECLGTPDEHTDTFYRHGDWGIEEHNEHEFEVYAVVEGKPILVKEGFTTFRECTEFIRGSIASKRLETDVDEKDPENQTPKEEVKMVIKPFRMMMEDVMKADWQKFDEQVALNRKDFGTGSKSVSRNPVPAGKPLKKPFSRNIRGTHPNDTGVDTANMMKEVHETDAEGETLYDENGRPIGTGQVAPREDKVPSAPTGTPDLAGTIPGKEINPELPDDLPDIRQTPLTHNRQDDFDYDVPPKPEDIHSVHPLVEQDTKFEGVKDPNKGQFYRTETVTVDGEQRTKVTPLTYEEYHALLRQEQADEAAEDEFQLITSNPEIARQIMEIAPLKNSDPSEYFRQKQEILNVARKKEVEDKEAKRLKNQAKKEQTWGEHVNTTTGEKAAQIENDQIQRRENIDYNLSLADIEKRYKDRLKEIAWSTAMKKRSGSNPRGMSMGEEEHAKKILEHMVTTGKYPFSDYDTPEKVANLPIVKQGYGKLMHSGPPKSFMEDPSVDDIFYLGNTGHRIGQLSEYDNMRRNGVNKAEESDEDDEEDSPSFRDLVKAETDKVDATRGLPTGYRYKPETRVFRDLYRTTVIDGKDDISTVMPKTKD